MTVNDVKVWYNRWYAPNNATLVIAGDVKADEVFALAQRYYGSNTKKDAAAAQAIYRAQTSGHQTIGGESARRIAAIGDGLPCTRAPDPKQDWQPYALQMLAGVLDGNESARLNKDLVREQQIASDTGADYDAASRGPSLFTLEATPSTGKTVQDVEAALRGEIAQLVKDGVSEDELKRVKAQVLAAEVYKRDSVFYQAMQIGQLESIGLGYQAIPVMLEKLQAVTAEQVQQVAREFLQDDNLTVAVLDPQPLSGKPKHKSEGGSSNVR